jgi:hypothetical protein
MKELLNHIYGYVTDENDNGDMLKLAGAILVMVSIVRFVITGLFDPISFSTGAGCIGVSKAIDIPAVIKNK